MVLEEEDPGTLALALEGLWGVVSLLQGKPELVPLLDARAPEVRIYRKICYEICHVDCRENQPADDAGVFSCVNSGVTCYPLYAKHSCIGLHDSRDKYMGLVNYAQVFRRLLDHPEAVHKMVTSSAVDVYGVSLPVPFLHFGLCKVRTTWILLRFHDAIANTLSQHRSSHISNGLDAQPQALTRAPRALQGQLRHPMKWVHMQIRAFTGLCSGIP